jgi:hypothetical protein
MNYTYKTLEEAQVCVSVCETWRLATLEDTVVVPGISWYRLGDLVLDGVGVSMIPVS